MTYKKNLFEFQELILNRIGNQIATLSLDENGSFVISCILIHGTAEHRSTIYREITRQSVLENLIQQRYGTYVIRNAIRMYFILSYFVLKKIVIFKHISLIEHFFRQNIVLNRIEIYWSNSS